jgi:acyl carrier protein
MDFEHFAHRLVNALKIEGPDRLARETGLFDDLGVDSFLAFQMLIMIEQWADLLVPPPYLPEMFTLGDAFDYFQEAQRLAAESATL